MEHRMAYMVVLQWSTEWHSQEFCLTLKILRWTFIPNSEQNWSNNMTPSRHHSYTRHPTHHNRKSLTLLLVKNFDQIIVNQCMLSVWKLFGFSFDLCLLIRENPYSSPSGSYRIPQSRWMCVYQVRTCIEQLADPFQECYKRELIRFVVLVNVLCMWMLISLMVTREEF